MTARDRIPGEMTNFEGIVFVGAEPASAQAQLEHDARYGREVAQRLDALMLACREERHAPTYADLLSVRGEV